MLHDPVPPGLTFLDHTADVGLEVAAPNLPELFARAAAGMACLIRGEDSPGEVHVPGSAGGPGERRVTLSAQDRPALLRAWLREVLHWHEAEGLLLQQVSFTALTATELAATVALVSDPLPPVREIKGVTLHGLVVEPRGGSWFARVIFDV